MTIPFKKENLFYFIVFALLVILLRLPSFNMILDTDSSVNAFFARHMMQGEVLYDKYHPAHHLPGIYYTFLIAFSLFGDNPIAPKALLILFIIPTTWLVYWIGREFFDQRAGILGGFFYVLITSQLTLSGMSAEMEHFANFPLTATMFLFIILTKKNAPAIKFVWVGVVAAVSILYKVTFVGSLAAVGFSLCIGVWLERKQSDTIKKYFSRFAAITLGVILPLVMVGGYFASLGLWGRFLLVFSFGFNYFGDTSLMGTMGDTLFPRPFGFPLFVMVMNNFAILVFGLFGIFRLVRQAASSDHHKKLVNLTLVLWLIISFALAGMRGGGFAHYILVVCPPLALITGIELSLAYENWRQTSSHKQATVGVTVMVFLVLALYVWKNYELYLPYLAKLSGQISYEETYDQFYQRRQEILNDYVKSHTAPDDFIYVWSTHLQHYYYADRLPPIDILWPEYVSATGSPQRVFDPRTKYIFVDSEKIRERPDWLIEGLELNYHLETIIYGQEIYRRNGS